MHPVTRPITVGVASSVSDVQRAVEAADAELAKLRQSRAVRRARLELAAAREASALASDLVGDLVERSRGATAVRPRGGRTRQHG